MKTILKTDSPAAATGYGIVAYNMLLELQKYSKVYCVLTNWDGKDINATLEASGKERFNQNVYFFSPQDQNGGIETIQRMVTRDQFDFLILNDDFARIDNLYRINDWYKYFPKPYTISYANIDHVFGESWNNLPVNEHPNELAAREMTLSQIKMNVPTAEHGYNFINKYFPKFKGNRKPIFYGLDFENYKPAKDKRALREKYFSEVKDDEILLINNNRNSPRKDILGACLIFYEVWKKYPVCRYYLHTNIVEQGQHLFDLLVNAGIPADHINKCFILNHENNIIDGGLPEDMLGEKTSACDINFNTGMGEGVGLSNYQAMACKVLNVIPDTTGIKEIVNNGKGVVIPTDWYWYWNGANPHICRPADFQDSVKVLSDVVFNLYKDRNYYSREIETAFNWIQDKSVENFRKQWSEIFKNLMK